MTILFEIKELIIVFYKKFEKIIAPIGKLLFSFLVLVRLNHFLGYNPLLNKSIVSLALAVVATFIPGSWFVLLLIAVICGQLFTVSMEATLIMGVAMLVVYLLFVRIFPKMAYFVILVPFLISFKIGYLTPLAAGLFFGPTSVVAVGVGVVIHRFASYIPGLLEVKSESLYDIPQTVMSMYHYIVNALTQDREMMLTVIVFACVLAVTYFVSKMEYDHIWYIAIGAGSLVNILGFIMGTLVLKADLSVIGVIFGTLVAAILCSIAQFMRFSLDYQRAEKVQFEDDDYYYYVKALPKIKIAKTQKAIHKIK